MTGRGRSSRGRGGQGGPGGRTHGRGNNYSSSSNTKHKGLCAALGNHVFDYGQRGCADQMRNTWEKITHHVGTIYGHDISNELQNKTKVTIPKPEHSQEILDRHQDRVTRLQGQNLRLALARDTMKQSLEDQVADGDTNAPMKLAILENEIKEAAYKATIDIPIVLTGDEQNEYDNVWKTYQERQAHLEK